jgi:predicted Na+-dependent transporter
MVGALGPLAMCLFWPVSMYKVDVVCVLCIFTCLIEFPNLQVPSRIPFPSSVHPSSVRASRGDSFLQMIWVILIPSFCKYVLMKKLKTDCADRNHYIHQYTSQTFLLLFLFVVTSTLVTLPLLLLRPGRLLTVNTRATHVILISSVSPYSRSCISARVRRLL